MARSNVFTPQCGESTVLAQPQNEPLRQLLFRLLGRSRQASAKLQRYSGHRAALGVKMAAPHYQAMGLECHSRTAQETVPLAVG
jgi:hypothetical protein